MLRRRDCSAVLLEVFGGGLYGYKRLRSWSTLTKRIDLKRVRRMLCGLFYAWVAFAHMSQEQRKLLFSLATKRMAHKRSRFVLFQWSQYTLRRAVQQSLIARTLAKSHRALAWAVLEGWQKFVAMQQHATNSLCAGAFGISYAR